MTLAMRTNGLHHAISLGHIEVSNKEIDSVQFEKSYDSDDEDMSRHRLRTSSSSELYPRTSVYSKGDIREQYCLTDRQLNSIERPRRERFFGCLSRKSSQQSFLGVCVGRRVPSDENLAAYAPFYKYPRYQHHYPQNEKGFQSDLESSYFRRQPASILSTAKMSDSAVANRHSWAESHASTSGLENPMCSSDQRVGCHLLPVDNYCQDFYIINSFNPEMRLSSKPSVCVFGYATHRNLQQSPTGTSTPRTKHVSFARSHTLTSFDDVNLGLHSSARMKNLNTDERLIGSKKPITTSGSIFEPTHISPKTTITQRVNDGTEFSVSQHQNEPRHPHIHEHHMHHHGPPLHVHKIVPFYHRELENHSIPRHDKVDNIPDVGMKKVNLMCHPTNPSTNTLNSPAIALFEKKFRHVMKTQATQTDLRKERVSNLIPLSPTLIHKVKVVSQGAQTNGLLNGKKLTKSLSEMSNDKVAKENGVDGSPSGQKLLLGEHEALYRTHSEEPPRFSKETVPLTLDSQSYVKYYKSPAPPEIHQQSVQSIVRRSSRIPSTESQSYSLDDKIVVNSSMQSVTTHSDIKCDDFNQTFTSYEDSSANFEESDIMNAFDYESNSLPRRACSYHRLDNDLYSNSLPRKDPIHSLEICRHITDCAELLGESTIIDYSRPHLVPPPRQYRRTDVEPLISQKFNKNSNRRMSMFADDIPFKRDDIRRQSMPAMARSEKLTIRVPECTKPPMQSEEKEIFIDFKPHLSPTVTTKRRQIHRRVQYSDPDNKSPGAKSSTQEEYAAVNAPIDNASIGDSQNEIDEEGDENEVPLYENVLCVVPCEPHKGIQFRKRSISLEDPEPKGYSALAKSDPPSPCQDELLVYTSTYPSSDSLANDLTRDHSDGIWNESQVTVLTADIRDQTEKIDIDQGSNHLLTPSSKRKNLILQHQQRSSIDTEALDFEDQLTDYSPSSCILSTKTPSVLIPNTAHTECHEFSTTSSVVSNTATPIIAVTPIASTTNVIELSFLAFSPDNCRKSPKSLSPVLQNIEVQSQQDLQHKIAEIQSTCSNHMSFGIGGKSNPNNTDVSECSTNTDEYVTCTDTSKRTPVSGQSSQTEKTQGGSSFESASSLYSTRGDVVFDDVTQTEKNSLTIEKTESGIKLIPADMMTKRSPSHSISSTSSGSYNIAGIRAPLQKCLEILPSGITETSPLAKMKLTSILTSVSSNEKENVKIKTESLSDDERSELRYSSSGYYESPHDEDHNTNRLRRHRFEDDRKRRRTSMKLDIEKENLRALTSPVKKLESIPHREESCDKTLNTISADVIASPSKIKRFRPKIRRQMKRTSREENMVRRQKNAVTMTIMPERTNSNELFDIRTHTTKSTVVENMAPADKLSSQPTVSEMLNNGNAPIGDIFQLKAKSIESLRSVSPGSDSVFYSEADLTVGDQHSHCLHCGKELEASNVSAEVGADDSAESLPCIVNDLEQDIVRPPSDFADSPVITKTTQRLYKKMDKRFRSEERYNTERGRHYKSRQDNIRAKSEERGREKSVRSPLALRPAGSSPSVLPDINTDQRQLVIYRGHYDQSRYCRLTDVDVWTQLDHQSFDRQRDRRASTDSEKSFHTKYQVILHRLVQRRCTLEMYHRQKNNIFKLISSNSSPGSVRRKLEEVLKLMLLLWAREGQALSKFSYKNGIDKTVVVKSESGEFGFRIHGSKPVVVAAIEPDTPAESSGLEVGDIIISVNGVQVLDKHHTEVVKIAHAGCDTLTLEVARTIGVLMSEQQELPVQPIFCGYLWRQSGQARGAPNVRKWVRRWFCLRPDHCLYYYKTENDSQPVGAMIMAKHTVEQCSPEIGKPFAFKIDCGEGIPMFVAADSEELASQWMVKLKYSAVQSDPWLEKCARTLHQPPSGIVKQDCFGYLMKLGSRWCGWSKRYCVLQDACLYFFQDANSKSAFGMACLQGYKVASMSTNASGRKNSFELIPQEPKLRHYYFSTESEMDKKRWISALEYSIDRWIKSG